MVIAAATVLSTFTVVVPATVASRTVIDVANGKGPPQKVDDQSLALAPVASTKLVAAAHAEPSNPARVLRAFVSAPAHDFVPCKNDIEVPQSELSRNPDFLF